ncbi:MAG: histidine kinase [Flavobacteriales bacterium]|nr:histidine kinase [Flavobacteriales bacterium]
MQEFSLRFVVALAGALLLGPGTICAQDAALVPSIQKELAAATDDTARSEFLSRICFNLTRSAPDSALIVGEQALTLAKQTNNTAALGDAHNNLGWLAVEQGHFARADSLLGIALDLYQKLDDPAYAARALSNLGWLAQKKGDSVGSLKRFQEALRKDEAAQDSSGIAILLYSIGSTYRNLKEYISAEDYLQRALALERSMGRKSKEANCLMGLANLYREQGDTSRAAVRFAEAASLYKLNRDHAGAGLVQENIGDMVMKHSPLRALEHYRLAMVHYDSIGSVEDKAYVLKSMGIAQTALMRFPEAQVSLAEGSTLAASTGSMELVMDYELARAQLAAATGDAHGTLRHYDRYTAIKDSLQGQNTQNELARLRTEFETERKEQDNAILKAANSEKAERLRRKDIQLYAIIALCIAALVAAWLFRRNYRQKRKHAEVLESLNAQLADSNAEITEINGLLESKLLRSQMNPHFIYNGLNSAMRMTQAGKTAEALAYLQGFARLLRMVLDHSVNDTVTISEELDFLRQYLHLESNRLAGLSFKVEAEPALIEDEAVLPALVVQPFVENAVWHGLSDKEGERSVQVRFIMDGNGIRCTITDNGVGRGHSSKTKGSPAHRSLGMQLTDERLRLLSRRLGGSGSVEVEDLLNVAGVPSGTCVTLHLGMVD